MTVALLAQWGGQPAGTLYTSDAATEAALIAAKEATANLAGSVVWVPPGNSPSAQQVLLSPAQYAQFQGVLSGAGNYAVGAGLVFDGATQTPTIVQSNVTGFTSGYSTYNGEPCFQFTATGVVGGNIELQFHTIPAPFSGDSAVVEYQCVPGETTTLSLFIALNSSYAAYGLVQRIHAAGNTYSPLNHNGMNSWCPTDAEITKNGYATPTGDAIWQAAKLRVNIADGVTTTFRLRSLKIGAQRNYGRIAVTCDDGYSSFYRLALPMFEQYGIPVTFCIIPSLIGTGSFMTMAQLKDIIARGHQIIPHGPDTGVGSLFTRWATNAQRIADINATRDYIVNNGLSPTGAAQKCYAWPGGQYAATLGESSLLDLMTQNGYIVGRSAAPSNYSTIPQNQALIPLNQSKLTMGIIGHTYAGVSNTADDATETANIAALVSRVSDISTSRKDGFLMLHDVVARGNAPAGGLMIEMDRLRTLAAAIRTQIDTGRLRAVTMSQMAP